MKLLTATPLEQSSRRSLLGLLTAGALYFGPTVLDLPSASAAAQFRPEVQVTPAAIIDYEFDQPRSRFTFTDSRGNLWIGKVDPVTGEFKPNNGQGLLVDTGTALATDFGNGPEWMYSAEGPQIIYTKYLPNQPRTAANARIGRAVVVNNAWVPSFIDADVPHTSPLGTTLATDVSGRVSYDSPASLNGGVHRGFFERIVDVPTSEVAVPYSYGTLADATRRWIPGTHTTVFSAPFTDALGLLEIQAFSYNSDTNVLEQLTYDDGAKKEVFLWQAPEYGGETIMFTIVGGRELRIYRKLDNGTGTLAWTAVSHVTSPTVAPIIWSPEPFVYNGKSYIFMVLSPSNQVVDPTAPTIIGMVATDSTSITYLTDPRIKVVRADPEVFFTTNGPYIYYNSYAVQTGTSGGGSIGVWRVDAGLGPTP